MKKSVVVYHSQTGFTERYARWIAEASGAHCMPLDAAKRADLSGYDAIVYGGWAMAGTISKLGWFKKNIDRWPGKTLIAFCVGGSPADSPDVMPALQRNFTADQLARVSLFYLPGGFNYEKMGRVSKLMMKVFISSLQKKKDKTPQEEVMVRMIASSYDISDRKTIEPIVALLR